MRQVSFISLVSVLALFMGGCPASEDESVSTVPSTPTPEAVPASPQPSPSQAPFTNPPVTAREPGRPQAVAGLVQTLPPGARRVPQGRTDPFAAFPLQPQVSVSPDAQGGGTNNRPVPQVPQLPPLGPNGGPARNQPRANQPRANQPRANQPRANQPRANRPSATRRNVLPSPRRLPTVRNPIAARPPLGSPSNPGTSVPVPNSIPTLPRLPEPNLARGIQVTGVVDVAGVPNAIVQVPNEPSRYVRVGQRLANGQVLVKRIDMRGPNPVVILEQYGIEVARRVGEPPAGGVEQPGSSTAALPPPPPVNTNVSPQA